MPVHYPLQRLLMCVRKRCKPVHYTTYKFSLTDDCLTLQFEGEPAVIEAVYIEIISEDHYQ